MDEKRTRLLEKWGPLPIINSGRNCTPGQAKAIHEFREKYSEEIDELLYLYYTKPDEAISIRSIPSLPTKIANWILHNIHYWHVNKDTEFSETQKKHYPKPNPQTQSSDISFEEVNISKKEIGISWKCKDSETWYTVLSIIKTLPKSGRKYSPALKLWVFNSKSKAYKQYQDIKTKLTNSIPKDNTQQISRNKPISKLDYYEYIQSPEWKQKSKEAKERAMNRCQLCYRPSNEIVLHTHHRTYERLGNELDTDLTVLCEECHKIFETTSQHRPAKQKD